MKTIKVALFTSLITLTTLVKAEEFALDKFTLETGVKTTIVNAKDLRARLFGFNIDLLMEDKLNEDLIMFLDTSITLETGANESIGTVAEFEPKEGINLNAGGIRYEPNQYVELQAGALNQGVLNSPLLISDNAFAAASQTFSFGSFYMSATQAIPSNNKLSKRIGGVDDGNPFFAIQTLGVEFGDNFKFAANISHFKFTDISSAIADKSRELGNSVSGSSASSKFNYSFEGINSTLSTSYTLHNKFMINFSGQYIYNEKAPEGRNKGYIAHLSLGKPILTVGLESFENGSDTSPSFYNSSLYGHNNMKGSGISIASKKADIKFVGKYITAQVMETNLVQTNMNILTLELVRTYEF